MNNKSFKFQVSGLRLEPTSFKFQVLIFKLKRRAARSADARFSNVRLETRNLKQQSERRARSRGFTLVEMISVIAITAIVAAATAVFIRLPLQGYQEAQRRAEITDAADTAFILIKRDLQTALPNSVRVTNVGAVYYLEFLQMRTGGRYRSAAPSPVIPPTGANTCPDVNGNGLADENVLEFGVADTCFTSLGPLPNLGTIVAGSDFVVVYNLGPGFAGANAYASGPATGGNKSLITAAAAGAGGENVIQFQANTFTLESPGRRVQIISGPVSYVCDPGAGTLVRYAGYPINAVQQTPPPGAPARVAQNIAAAGCLIFFNVANQRNSVVSLWLSFTDPALGAAVNLFDQVQISNVP